MTYTEAIRIAELPHLYSTADLRNAFGTLHRLADRNAHRGKPEMAKVRRAQAQKIWDHVGRAEG